MGSPPVRPFSVRASALGLGLRLRRGHLDTAGPSEAPIHRMRALKGEPLAAFGATPNALLASLSSSVRTAQP